MRVFLKNIIYLIIVLIAILVIANSILWDYVSNQKTYNSINVFEDPGLIAKYGEFTSQNSESKFKTIFFGTSRIYRQVNPVLFDSLTNQGERSFNLGYTNLYPFRLFDFILKTINQNQSINKVFIELAPLADIGRNYNSLPIKSSVTWNRVMVASDFYSRYGDDDDDYIVQIPTLRYFQAFVWRYLSPGILQEVLLSRINQSNIFTPTSKRGYSSLDTEEGEEYDLRRKTLQGFDLTKFKDPTTLLTKGANNNDLYFHKLLDLTVELLSKNIKVYFIIPPRTDGYSQFMADYSFSLQEKGFVVFNLSQPNNFPELFAEQYSFDRAHLNSEGADYMTRYLANEYLKMNLSDH